jgi:hypothetical protein
MARGRISKSPEAGFSFLLALNPDMQKKFDRAELKTPYLSQGHNRQAFQAQFTRDTWRNTPGHAGTF